MDLQNVAVGSELELCEDRRDGRKVDDPAAAAAFSEELWCRGRGHHTTPDLN